MSLKETLSTYWLHIQGELLPWLDAAMDGPLMTPERGPAPAGPHVQAGAEATRVSIIQALSIARQTRFDAATRRLPSEE